MSNEEKMVQALESIAKSLMEIAESTKETAAHLRKWDSQGLPPGFVEMNEAWQQRWSAA
ncbi:hypothetical protein ACIPL1_24685 [Pseudomonas sp. NPDC090202]|uniref:hypothetical protein n=1 Tax=Pseudomonas sp. NPDC090202 TaxID=3364476 RepID=UPI00380916C0